MTGHTPGPWAVAIDQPAGDEPGPTFPAIVEAEHGWHIADLQVIDDHLGEAPREANARLLAAAPELLEALESMIASAKNHRIPLTEKARAAIAKAKEQSS